MGNAIDLTEANFEQHLQKGGTLLIDFWATWCPPCRVFAPIFEAAAAQHPEAVFGKVDTEAQQALAGAFGITAIPTLAIFRDGILLFKEAGALPAAALESVIAGVAQLDMELVRKELAAQEGSEPAVSS